MSCSNFVFYSKLFSFVELLYLLFFLFFMGFFSLRFYCYSFLLYCNVIILQLSLFTSYAESDRAMPYFDWFCFLGFLFFVFTFFFFFFFFFFFLVHLICAPEYWRVQVAIKYRGYTHGYIQCYYVCTYRQTVLISVNDSLHSCEMRRVSNLTGKQPSR